ncbi:MAG: SpoIID/LytB domain-containing protein [Calditrichaeota bacterium]|nr:SpoIID/LytB domain-containing protein [Calditrichota bacterium]
MKLISLFLVLLSLIKSEHTVRVCLIETDQAVEITFSGFAVLYSEEARFQLNDQNAPISLKRDGQQIVFDGKGIKKRYLIFQAGTPFYMDVTNRSNYIILNGQYYENNRLEFRLGKDNKIQVIATVPLEDYVRNVVPNEIRTNRPEELEAIKAQSIAARSYVLNNTNKYGFFDVYADVRDQVYKSSKRENTLVNEAITATRGQFLSFNGQMIDARYCSSMGGMRERPYYLGTESAITLSMYYNGKFLGQESDNYRWTWKFKANDLIYLFSSYSGQLVATDSTQAATIDLNVLERSEAGRVVRLEVKVDDKRIELQNLDIRRFFRQNDRLLPSRLFYLTVIEDEVILNGAGYGHGQGMGQWEAIDLARQGIGYKEILSLFYPQTEIKVIK